MASTGHRDPESQDKENPRGVPLCGDFTVSGRAVRLQTTNSGLTWNGQDQTSDWDDVITAYQGGVSRGPGVKARVGVAPEEDRFTLHYIEHQKINILRHKHVTFIGQAGQLKEWLDSVADKTGHGRPKCLLTLVNPIGGQKKGAKLYEAIVRPLFELAGIDAKLIITQRFRHAEEIAKTYDVTDVDGLIVSGGDGLMQEVIQGLITRFNVDFNDPDVELKPLPITLGALPTGSGNGISMACHGCTDLETATLAVVRGEKQYLNIVSVHGSAGPLVGYAGFATGYGFWADLFQHADEHRWLKTYRYLVGAFRGLFTGKREFIVEGEYLPTARPDKHLRAAEDMARNTDTEGWVKFSGTFTGINSFPGGFYRVEGKPGVLHWGQSGAGMNMFLEKQSSKLSYLKWMLGISNREGDLDVLQCNADNIEEHYVKEFRFSLRESDTATNGHGDSRSSREEERRKDQQLVFLDGEVRPMETSSMVVRNRRNVTEFFCAKRAALEPSLC
ncbi:ceramide kinase-like [Haliotis rubra]|uniref:ceramide kinase-like n=1 Tax=Haliotis rubra TaxID=36100 RepID=UPI001EE59F36|nr:ceramide kinase-like [Haliotis rubra]